jgi:hypothetical protein
LFFWDFFVGGDALVEGATVRMAVKENRRVMGGNWNKIRICEEVEMD